eukprot:SAG31_NODE_688_length_12807_cov_6.395814_3_plen_88_part_00
MILPVPLPNLSLSVHLDALLLQFIAKRDGFPADKENIFLTDGASAGVRMVYTTMVDSSGGMDGMMVPIPQYPLYSALATLHNAHLVG